MASEWHATTLGKFVRLQRGHDLTAANQHPGPYPVMGSAGQNGTHDEFIARGPGVVIGRSGASIGRVHFTHHDYWPHNTCLYVTDFLGNDPKFAFYLLGTLDLANYNSGSVQPSLNRNYVYAKPLRVPGIDEQQEIAGFLGTLDDRIDLLRQTNTTLEAIAQALFKSWFVDFDPVHAKAGGCEPEAMDAATATLFPSEFEESELGLIPKGSSVKSFGDSVTILGGGTPKTSIPEYWDGDIPWFSVVDAPVTGQVFTLDTTKKITRLGLENCSAKLLPPMTTIISARGTVGKVAMTGSEMVINQSCYGLRPKVVGGEPFTYFSTLRFVDGLRQIAHGAVFDTITRNSFDQLLACRPPDRAIAHFGAMTAPLLDRIRMNGHQATSLAQLRDTLLSRLISGKLRLPEARELAEAEA